ncbi:hypothetical protein [Microbacterium sp. NPDC096154]|uniref:hypothetical protein n=1 Tax=Microbacterium sp. NPDC096154 TaxID=3155549 RepID=UPI00332C080A
MTGQTPVIGPDEVEAAKAAREAEEAEAAVREEQAQAVEAEPVESAQDEPSAEASPAEEAEALESAAEESSAPAPSFGFGEQRPLTRRQVREQERLRTNGVPIIDAEQDAVSEPAQENPWLQAAEDADIPDEARPEGEPNVAAIETVVVGENETSVLYEVVEVPFDHGEAAEEAQDEPTDQDALPVAQLVYDEGEQPADAEEAGEAPGEPSDAAEPAGQHTPRFEQEFLTAPVQTVYVPDDAALDEQALDEDALEEEPEDRPTVAPAFGSTVLKTPARPTSSASFEEILSHSMDSSGSATAGSALILATDPGTIPLSAPIDSTGEILVTSTHALPEGFGSRGHVAGTTDGKDVDVVLIDGELPLASSPTPIAASDAVSTSKSPSEVIRPPAPEKTHRLTLLLGITAGVLGIALIGVVVAAFTTGVLG